MIFLAAIYITAFFCIGGFHEFAACLISVALLVYLGLKKNLTLKLNWVTGALAGTTLFYGISTLWAVDPGMAFLGFMKFLPVPLFAFCLQQEPEAKAKLQALLPYLAAAATVISSVGSLFTDFFTVDGRLAGFFQYPNAFALVLLAAELLLLGKDKLKFYDLICLAILVFGIFYTGSRTVFVLAAVANLIFLFLGKNKKIKLAAVCGIGVLAFVLFGFGGVFGRFSTISFSSSTFLGRFLYFFDALPEILTHPFGLGYMGYYYTQQAFQSGIYSVAFVHNDFLQLMLDVGWLPALAILAAIILSFKKLSPQHRVLLGVMVLHFCFDFDLQFIAIWMVLLLFLDTEGGKELRLKKQPVACGAATLVCLYFGIALSLAQCGLREAAQALYPWNTRNETALLAETEDPETAEHILARNDSVTLAQSVLARTAYSKGDFGKVIQYKNALFEKAPFQYAEYEEYCYMLINGIALYNREGDSYSAGICAKELIATREKVRAQADRLSALGKRISDQPVMELPAEIENYIAKLEAAE